MKIGPFSQTLYPEKHKIFIGESRVQWGTPSSLLIWCRNQTENCSHYLYVARNYGLTKLACPCLWVFCIDLGGPFLPNIVILSDTIILDSMYYSTSRVLYLLTYLAAKYCKYYSNKVNWRYGAEWTRVKHFFYSKEVRKRNGYKPRMNRNTFHR